MTVTVKPFRERFTNCASCRAEARFMVDTVGGGHATTACQRHVDTWVRRIEKLAN